MNGAMYRFWHNNIALPPVKILAGIIVYVRGGYFIYEVPAGLRWYLKYGIHKQLPHVTSLDNLAAHNGFILQKKRFLQHILRVTKDVFQCVRLKKKFVPGLEITSQNLFPPFFCRRLMSRIRIIIAFQSLTCLTFTVLSAEALLYCLLMASRLHLG